METPSTGSSSASENRGTFRLQSYVTSSLAAPSPPLQYTRRNRRREVQINRNVFIFHVSRPPTFSPRRLSTTGVVNLINQLAKLFTPTHAISPSSFSSFFRVEEFSRAVIRRNLRNRERKFVSGIYCRLSFRLMMNTKSLLEEKRDYIII